MGVSPLACFLTWSFQGDKNIIKFEGDHNSPRPQFYFDSINIFFHNVLQPPEDEVAGTYFEPMIDYFGKVNPNANNLFLVSFRQGCNSCPPRSLTRVESFSAGRLERCAWSQSCPWTFICGSRQVSLPLLLLMILSIVSFIILCSLSLSLAGKLWAL